jgi:hypothetical protein
LALRCGEASDCRADAGAWGESRACGSGAWSKPEGGTALVLNTGTYTLDLPVDTAVSGTGDLYICDSDNNRIVVSNQETAPSLTFASSNVGTQSSDSPQTVTLLNLGNEPLNIASATFATTTPSSGTSFSGDASTTCTSSLAADSSCVYGINFDPAAGGSNSGSLTLTDNTLNATGSTQVVALGGTGVAVTQLAYSTAPASTLTAGGNAGSSITVDEENTGGTTVTSATDTITLTVTGPNGYSQVYTETAVAGVATFNLGSVPLTGAGGYTYTASIVASPSVSDAVANETVSAGSGSSLTGSGSAVSGQTQTIGLAYTYAFTVVVKDSYGNPVSGATVNYSVPSTGASAILSASSATSNASGVATVTGTANSVANSFVVTASVAGISGTVTFPVTNTKGTVAVGLTATPVTPIIYGSAQTTLAATVSSPAGTPTGNITFNNNASALGAPAPLAAGSASASSYLTAGAYSLTAAYPGDPTFLGGTSSPPLAYTVNKAPVTLTAASSQTVTAFSTTSTLNLTVTGAYSGTGILVRARAAPPRSPARSSTAQPRWARAPPRSSWPARPARPPPALCLPR